jgi:hypothetical protein
VTIRYRRMKLQDIPACISFVASQPVTRARYPSMDELAKAWATLIDDEFVVMGLYEEGSGAGSTVWGVSAAAFVNESFIHEIKTPPFFWIGAELARRVNAGSSPVLTSREIRRANSTDGLNIVVFLGNIRPAKPLWAETYYAGVMAFFDEFRGYRIKEVIGSQADSAEFLSNMLQSGAMLYRPESDGLADPKAIDLEQVVRSPHVLTSSRRTARLLPGSWFSSVFDYHPPVLKLSPSQQRLLLHALKGDTDQLLAEKLHISLAAVKKSWAAIYARAEVFLPELARIRDAQMPQSPRRGAECKRRVISHIRENMQELRPVSHALLSKRNAAADGSV